MSQHKKTIWLVNFHAKPPHLEGYLKTIKFAQYLEQAGYESYIFASNNFHNREENSVTEDSNASYTLKEYDGLKFIHIKTIAYKNSSKLRMLSLFQFSIKLFLLRKRFNRPDILIHTAYSPFDNLVYYTAKALKAKYFVDILDLWPESFVDVGLIKKNNPILFFAYNLEKWLYKKANAIIFCMQGGKDYIKEKKWDTENKGPIDLNNVHWISNGVDLNDFYKNEREYKIADSDLENENLFKVVYIGSIRLANNMINLINAATYLKDQKKIRILIYGDGIDRDYLENYCKENEIQNVIFKQKWIDPKYVPYVLSKSSMTILNYKQGLGKYGGSQSKLFQYLASGKPICSNIEVKYCIIKENNLGISESFKNDEAYAMAILALFNLDKTEYEEIGKREKEIVKEYDYPVLTDKLISVIES
jgi:glycosyltransferase involved in cell wall biosynthesis